MVTHVGSGRFDYGHFQKETVVSHFSIILVRSGSIIYRVDNTSAHFSKDAVLLVPAWASRECSVDDPEGCELQWCDFSCPSEELNEGELLRSNPQDVALEQSTLCRMLVEWNSSATPNRLLLEGELKAQLARFFTAAKITEAQPMPASSCSTRASSVIERSLALCSKLYNEHNILSEMRTSTGLSAAHFRRVFKSQQKISPQSFVLRLRMRHARFLLHESERTIKEISDIVGYDDAFYFSRLYRRFWGCPPSEDRGRKTRANDRLSFIQRIAKPSIESSSAVYQ